ncbi:MAG: hypothetical protein Q7U04_15800 [Bacteriovorax sp.]|nr:hypothetical protein [Bacteriovorax sp.]
MNIRHASGVLFLTLFTLFSSTVFSIEPNFPLGPNPILTPGKICDKPASYRYPEHVAYCGRDVSYETKEILIENYDEKLGFHIQNMDRADFKIDHYIPLCAGGSNDTSNLWPQNKYVYGITDPVEPLVCEKMAAGRLKQIDAIKLIVRAKNNLNQVNDVIKILNSL